MYTKHAKSRMQQRGLSPFIVDLLVLYGDEEHDGRGGVRYYFTKKSSKRLRQDLGNPVYKKIKHFLDAYAAECDGHIVTVGWRH
jgi:hypothetical protein